MFQFLSVSITSTDYDVLSILLAFHVAQVRKVAAYRTCTGNTYFPHCQLNHNEIYSFTTEVNMNKNKYEFEKAASII